MSDGNFNDLQRAIKSRDMVRGQLVNAIERGEDTTQLEVQVAILSTRVDNYRDKA